jgi:NAD(P)-dependent dehydrogenase (short-subunit alcohol dehydrogenase family)
MSIDINIVEMDAQFVWGRAQGLLAGFGFTVRKKMDQEEITDVRHEDEVKNLVDRTIARFGRLDIAIGNAGTVGTPGSFRHTMVGCTCSQNANLFSYPNHLSTRRCAT